MKKYYKLFLLVVFALACTSSMVAQTGEYDEQLTVEQLREEIRIQKQELRVAAKEFLVDELPGLIELDPDRADMELQKFSSILGYLGDNEVLYLLGHMYARVGENDKAISIFDSLLRTDLNQGARKMLNLVMYRKLIDFLQAGDRDAARDFMRVVVFENYNTEQYFPAYLYLYSDLSADSGNYAEVINLIESYNSNRDIVLNDLLPVKQMVLERINNLDLASYYQNPTQAEFNRLNAQIDQTKVDLTAIYNGMIGLDGMLFVDAIVEAHSTEMTKLDELKQMLADYANTSVRTEEQLQPALAMIESVKSNLDYYDRLLQRFDTLLQQNFLELSANDPQQSEVYAGNLYLDRVIQTQKTIASYDEMIAEIDELLASGDFPEHTERLMNERQWAVTQKAEAEVLHQKYLADVQNTDEGERQYLTQLLEEYNYLVEDKALLQETATEMEDYVVTEARTIINDELREQIRPRISSQIGSIAYSADRDQVFTRGFGQALTSIDYITLQMAYRDLMAKYNQYLENQYQLSSEELETQKAYWRAEQLALIDEFNAFLAQNPSFSAIEQPGGGSLVGAADLYYNLAELQYYAIPEDLNPALVSYRRALQLDPDLPNRDLALYNIAFISSEIMRLEVSQNKIAYRNNARINDMPPANAVYSEANFSETQDALTEIVNNYPESPVYEESVYRLGLLNFSFSTDAEDPVIYRDRAVGYFDQIVANRQSPLYYEALYQRAWVRLNSLDQEELRLAMNDFMEILMATDSGLIADQQLAQDYRRDAVDNIAYCLIALDGTDFNSRSRGVAELQRVFEGYDNQQIVHQVIDRSAQYKLDMGVSLQAVDFLEFKIETVPLALENPVLLDSILVLYHNRSQELREGENLDTITQNIYQRQIDNYDHQSQWYAINSANDISKQMEIVNTAYTNRGLRLFNNFAANISKENLDAYESHMNRYDGFAQIHHNNYAAFRAETDSLLTRNYVVLADQTQDVSHLMAAIQRLYNYNDSYPANSQFYENEELAMNYARNIYAETLDGIDAGDYNPPAGAPADEAEAFAFLKRTADRYIDVANQERFSNPARIADTISIILLLGDIQLGKQKYPEAVAFYTQALEQSDMMSDNDKRETYLKLADISMREERFPDAENWFRRALPLAQSAEERASINQDILVQIQSNFEQASASGDYITEANERLRLAAEMDPSRSLEILGQKNEAVEAFKKAGAYQEAIDLLMELAATDNNIDAIYARYDQAVEIAESDSLMNNPALAQSLQNQFISEYPDSNYSFRLRFASIVAMEKNSATKAQAAEAYLALYEETVANQIDNGDYPESDLLANAISIYNQISNVERGYELMERFIATYPNHERSLPYMEYMAQGYYTRKEMESYNQLARQIYQKDPSKSSYYKAVADEELRLVAQDFDAARMNEDYDAAFAARDRYIAVESRYKDEGLDFDDDIYQIFAEVQTEYEELQKRNAFYADYDSSLQALENSDLFTRSPAQQIRVVRVTTWDRNLGGGDNRIPKYVNTVNAEVEKVRAVIRRAGESNYTIDNDRQLRALSLIANIYKRGAEVVKTQIETFFRITEQGEYYTSQWGDQAAAQINGFVMQNTQDYIVQSLTWNNQIYTQFHLAGYQNELTEAAKNVLLEYNQSTEYRATDYVFNDLWSQSLEPDSFELSISQIKTPKGQALGSTQIPASNTLRATRNFDIDLVPNFAYLHVIYPLDIEVKLNGSVVSSSWVAIDTLDVNNPVSTRYSYMIPGALFSAGNNSLEVALINDSSNSLQAAFALQTMTSLERIKENIPPVVNTIFTNQGWRIVTTDPETGEESSTYATDATEWNISWDNIANMDQNAARPIWVSEIDGPADNLVFETDFILDSEFKEGTIELIAPESVTVYLNGSELGASFFDYDPDPLTIYKGEILITAENVVMGRNVLRFEVTNSSIYRGFLAKITYSQAGKEEIR